MKFMDWEAPVPCEFYQATEMITAYGLYGTLYTPMNASPFDFAGDLHYKISLSNYNEIVSVKKNLI